MTTKTKRKASPSRKLGQVLRDPVLVRLAHHLCEEQTHPIRHFRKDSNANGNRAHIYIGKNEQKARTTIWVAVDGGGGLPVPKPAGSAHGIKGDTKTVRRAAGRRNVFPQQPRAPGSPLILPLLLSLACLPISPLSPDSHSFVCTLPLACGCRYPSSPASLRASAPPTFPHPTILLPFPPAPPPGYSLNRHVFFHVTPALPRFLYPSSLLCSFTSSPLQYTKYTYPLALFPTPLTLLAACTVPSPASTCPITAEPSRVACPVSHRFTW